MIGSITRALSLGDVRKLAMAAFSSSRAGRSADRHGLVALYGGFLGSLGVDRKAMAHMFAERASQIVSGRFATQLQAEKDAGYPTKAAIEALVKGDDPMSQAEARVHQALKGR